MTTWGDSYKELCLAGPVACAIFGLCTSAPAAETTYQRLLNARAEPQNWLMRMGSYSNWNHSGLDQINKSNVANLKVKFMASLSDPNRPSKGASILLRWSKTASCMWATSTSNTGN
jgi:glucose dehydrogenase